MLMNILNSTKAKVLTGVLLAQSAIFYGMSTTEFVPTMPPLESMPGLDGWTIVSQSKPEQEIQDLLKADDALTRVFKRGDDELSMFVAFFRTQRAGVVPHSPRVCLPGSGWTPTDSSFVPVTVPGRPEPITINRYVVTRGEQKSIVYYWYQTPHHISASEFAAKMYLMLDSVRYQRSDTALVRIIVSATDQSEAVADAKGLDFVRLAFPVVTRHLPR